jgi:hypothetical protein
MCAFTETDARNQRHDCTLTSGEGYSSHREMFHLLYAAVLFPLCLNILYIVSALVALLNKQLTYSEITLFLVPNNKLI